MLFSSIVFLWFFLPAILLIYWLAPGRTAKNAVLLTASLFFYSWGEPRYLFLLIITAALCYSAGLLLALFDGRNEADGSGYGELSSSLSVKPGRRGWRLAVVIFAVCIQLGILAYFKYYNFWAGGINSLLSLTGLSSFVISGSSAGGTAAVAGSALLPLRDMILPLGISFYTFQALSYLFDVWRRRRPAQKNPFYLALYLFLFPQLLSGPIIKYHELDGQLKERRESISLTAYGVRRFSFGLAKKVLLADSFGQAADRIFALPAGEIGTLTAWLAVILYSLQIYYDFSGYSDMAIGLGRMFGFRYAENFNYPYLSASITEFWRRWHISLSTWFREYLYIPLGGNRHGTARTCLNLFLVFLATGIWHGASMNFILWGVYYGVLIIAERLWLNDYLKKHPHPVLSRVYALLAVAVGWLLFRTETLDAFVSLLKVMVLPARSLWDFRIFANGKILFLTAAGILLCGPLQSLFPRLKAALYDEERFGVRDLAAAAVLITLSTAVIISGTYSAFIYFKF